MIKTGFVFDESGYYTLEAEAAAAVEELTAWGLPITVARMAHSMREVYQERYDLLVIDYGGLAVSGGAHANAEIYKACEWAENHPGSLLVLWTPYTEQVYSRELVDIFGHLSNILCRYTAEESAYDYSPNAGQRFISALKTWFGIQGKE